MVEADCAFTKGLRGLPATKRRPDCFACGKSPLPSARITWCSDECGTLWNLNHIWSLARAAVLKRDGLKCVRCGRGEAVPKELYDRRRERRKAWDSKHPRPPYSWSCSTYRAWEEALKKFEQQNDREINAYRLEVNHKEPRRGKSIAKSCRNHIDGLELLCHACHVEETKAQNAAHRVTNSPAVTMEMRDDERQA